MVHDFAGVGLADVFISYSRKDKTFATRLFDALEANGRDAWLDSKDIQPTAEWMTEIRQAIEGANAVIFVISPDSLISEVCRRELAHTTAHNKRLIPVVWRDPVDEKNILESLARLNWIFFRSEDSFDQAFQTLLKALDTDLDYVRLHTRLLVRAREWETYGKNDSFTLRGEDLRIAEVWLAEGVSKDPHALALQVEYITRSRQAERNRQRQTLAGVVIALVIAIILAVFAFNQSKIATNKEQARATAQQQAVNNAGTAVANENARATQQAIAIQQAGLAQSGRLAAYSQLERSQSLDLDVLLSQTALENYPYTKQAEQALADAVQHSRVRFYIPKVSKARWSPDGRWIAAAGQEGRLMIIDPWQRREQKVIPLQSIFDLDWSPDSKMLAAVTTNGTEIILDPWTGSARMYTAHSGRNLNPNIAYVSNPNIIKWSPTGKVIARIVQRDIGDELALMDAITGKDIAVFGADAQEYPTEVQTLVGSGNVISDLTWNKDGSLLAVVQPIAHAGGVLTVFTAAGKVKSSWLTEVFDHVTWSPVDDTIVAVSDSSHNNDVVIFSLQNGKPVRTIGKIGPHVDNHAWSPDGRWMAYVSSNDNIFTVWPTSETEPNTYVPNTQSKAVFTLSGAFDDVEWNADSRHLLVHDKTNQVLWVIDGQADASLITINGGYGAAWSPDGSKLINLSLQDPKNLTLGAPDLYDFGPVIAGKASLPVKVGSFIPDDQSRFGSHDYQFNWLMDGKGLEENIPFHNTNLWDVSKGSKMNLDTVLMSADPDITTDLVFSPYENKVVRATINHKTTDQSFEKVEILSPQGNLISTIQLPPSDTLIGNYSYDFFPEPVVAWSQDEKNIAISTGSLIRIYDTQTGNETALLKGHTDRVSSLSFSPDGHRLVSASGFFDQGGSGGIYVFGDHTVRIWDITTQSELYRLNTPDDTIITQAHWSPNGKFLLTTDPSQQNTKIWRIWMDIHDLLTYAKECCIVRGLSPEERLQFGLTP